MNYRSLMAVLFLSVCMAAPAMAKTMYIDDTLFAPLRSGEGTQYRILHKGLKSGTRVELLESSESGYSRVRTTTGTEGWLPTRYLSAEPIAAARLEQATKELEQARATLNRTQAELQEVTAERDRLASMERNLSERSDELATELDRITAISENALTLDQRNKELQQINQRLQNEVEVLAAEKERIEANNESDFLLYGAGIFLLGMLMTLVVPHLKRSKRSDNWV